MVQAIKMNSVDLGAPIIRLAVCVVGGVWSGKSKRAKIIFFIKTSLDADRNGAANLPRRHLGNFISPLVLPVDKLNIQRKVSQPRKLGDPLERN